MFGVVSLLGHPELVSELLHGSKIKWPPKCCSSDIMASPHVIPAPSFVIAAQAGIHVEIGVIVRMNYLCGKMDPRRRGDDVGRGMLHATMSKQVQDDRYLCLRRTGNVVV